MYIVYDGPSALDGAPIVGILTMKTRNRKTGDMAQLWILRSDVEPHKAVASGQDSSICGDCIHRHHTGGACYVVPFQAPLAIYRAYKAGSYSNTVDLGKFADHKIRLGAYGDPAALPIETVKPLIAAAAGHTGYTHQWDNEMFNPEWLEYVMASADTVDQARQLQCEKTRYFRVATTADTIERETVCLAESQGMACADCLLCDGGNKGRSVVIPVHGHLAARFEDVIASS